MRDRDQEAKKRRLLTEKPRMKDAILKLRKKEEARTWTFEEQVGTMIGGDAADGLMGGLVDKPGPRGMACELAARYGMSLLS